MRAALDKPGNTGRYELITKRWLELPQLSKIFPPMLVQTRTASHPSFTNKTGPR